VDDGAVRRVTVPMVRSGAYWRRRALGRLGGCQLRKPQLSRYPRHLTDRVPAQTGHTTTGLTVAPSQLLAAPVLRLHAPNM
jgi:hypothetical protein